MRHLITLAVAFLTLALLTACGRRIESADALAQSPDALVEGHDQGTVAWHVSPDGKVRAVIKDSSGKLLSSKATGQVTFKSSPGEPVAALQSADGEILEASGPGLRDDLNELRYALVVNGKPWTGTLLLPPGGTHALAEQARSSQTASLPEAGAGPHGGIVQVVGEDRVEVVADTASGQVRVYVLDTNLQPVPVGSRKLTLGVQGPASSHVVVLAPSGDGAWFEGTLATRTDPVKLTVAVTVDAHTHVALVGWHPGAVVIVGHDARPVRIWVKARWHEHDHGPDHGNVKVDVKLKGPGRGHGKDQIRIKIH